MLTLVTMADTHGYHTSLRVPPGDILIHAGDMTRMGTLDEVCEFDAFLASLPHRHKIVIAGNHDFCFQREPEAARAMLTHATYLEDEAVTIEGIRFYGSPWQPWFLDWAFNLPRGAPLAEKWARIPEDTDILVTHGPPNGIGDRTWDGRHVGCEELLQRVQQLRPRIHVFGHIHESGGVYRDGATVFVNAATSECASSPITVAYPP
jgi:Icc-related predicted phosphoesterase